MKELKTKFFGVRIISEDQIIYFPDGLYGFIDKRYFVLIKEKEDSPFWWLQSYQEEDLAFVLIEPQHIVRNYEPKITPMDLESLQVDKLNECKIYCILTIPENKPEDMTINLQGPVIINTKKNIGRQVISLDDKHGVRIKILDLMNKGYL